MIAATRQSHCTTKLFAGAILASGSKPHESAVFRAGEARLGITAKTRRPPPSAGGREKTYALLKAAARLLPTERVRHCHHTPAGSLVTVRAGAGGAAYKGLQTCGSTWHCPICSVKIARSRRDELNDLLAWARGRRLVPVLLTLTMSHNARMPLRAALDMLKGANARLHRSKPWMRLKGRLAGSVTASEVTYGEQNGWHPHLHVLLLVRAADEGMAVQAVEQARAAWGRALEAEGGYCGRAGYQVQGAAQAGRYIAKWGPAEEISLGRAKEGKAGGRSPWQLLAQAVEGDEAAARLWQEYAISFKGRRQLVWSRGLKKAAGICDQSDEDLAAAEDLDQGEDLIMLERPAWRQVLAADLRAALLDAAEAGGLESARRLLAAAGIVAGVMPAYARPPGGGCDGP